MEINDASMPNGQFDTAQFLTDGLERAEILCDARNRLCGADAMVRTVSITAQKGKGQTHDWLCERRVGIMTQLIHYIMELSHMHMAERIESPLYCSKDSL